MAEERFFYSINRTRRELYVATAAEGPRPKHWREDDDIAFSKLDPVPDEFARVFLHGVVAPYAQMGYFVLYAGGVRREWRP